VNIIGELIGLLFDAADSAPAVAPPADGRQIPFLPPEAIARFQRRRLLARRCLRWPGWALIALAFLGWLLRPGSAIPGIPMIAGVALCLFEQWVVACPNCNKRAIDDDDDPAVCPNCGVHLRPERAS